MDPGSALIAHGRVDSGGLTLGLRTGDGWYRRLDVTEPGNFFAIVEVDRAGTYVPSVSHLSPKSGWLDRFTLVKFGTSARPQGGAGQ